MTIAEMVTLFKLRYNNNTNTRTDISDDSIYLFLNSAINRFIKQRFTGNNARQVAYEGDQKRNDDLLTLVTTATETLVDPIDWITNARKVRLPTDYLFLDELYLTLTRDSVNYKTIGEKIIADDAREFMFIENINIPLIDAPKFYFEGSELIIIYENTDTLVDVTFRYLKQPQLVSVSQNSDLPIHTHEEIVEIAIGLALENDESQRTQLHQQKLNVVE